MKTIQKTNKHKHKQVQKTTEAEQAQHIIKH